MSSTRRDELELRVAHRPHFRQIESFEFRFCAHALTYENVHEEIEDIGDREDNAYECSTADELSHELPRIAVEESGDRSIYSVPTAAVVACPVSEEAEREHSPEAARPVHRDCADRVVNLHHPLNKLDAQANQESRDKSKNHRADWIDKAAGCGDCHEPCKEAIATHRSVGLAEA